MRNLKNKKRLISLVAVFALVFAIGAAFALDSNTLDIRGAVSIAAPEPDRENVIWSNAVAITPLGTGFNVVQSAEIIDVDGGEKNRIEWTISFPGGEGFAALTATATNDGLVAADIVEVTADWEYDESEFDIDDFGFTIDYSGTLALFSATPLAPGASRQLTVEIDWSGDIPDGFDAEEFDATFVIEFTTSPS